MGRIAGGMICSDIADGVVGAGIATKLDIREVIVGAIAGLRTPLKGLAKLMLSVLG